MLKQIQNGFGVISKMTLAVDFTFLEPPLLQWLQLRSLEGLEVLEERSWMHYC